MALLTELAGEVELAGRPDLCCFELCDRFLSRRIERADVFHIVAEPLRAPRTRAVNAEHVDDAASHREVPGDRDRAIAPVSELHEPGHERVARQPRTALYLGQPRP